MSDQFITTKHAKETLCVSDNTLRMWGDKGWIQTIRTPADQRLYNVQKFLREKCSGGVAELVPGKKICYCRVSSNGQRDDLQRQIEFMRERFPEYEVITDIASGLNFKRKGLQTILEQSFDNLVTEIVVAHKDRLCRFGYDLVEWILKKHGARIVVLDQSNPSSEEELATDIISIVHVFSCRINGKRKYRKKNGEMSIDKGREADEKQFDKTLSIKEGHEENPDMV